MVTRRANAARAALGTLLALLIALACAGTATASGDDECENAVLGEWACSTLNGLPGVSSVYGYLGDVHRAKADAVADVLGDVVPDNFVEEWVNGMAESTVGLLSYIQVLGERVTRPAFDQEWWTSQYAVSFGLSMLLLAVLLVWITARFAAAGSSATAADLLRQSGWRVVFVVPLISAGPLLLLELQLAANAVARSFADRGTGHAHSAVERLMDLIIEQAGDWGVFGGTVLALLLFLCILCLGLVTLIELAVAQWGLYLASLLVPLVLVAWVYPPWSAALRRLASLLGGLLLLPAFVYFFFHTIWSAFDSVMADRPDDDGLVVLLFLLVGLLMIDAFPVVVMWLMSLATPPGGAMDPAVRGAFAHASAGEMVENVVERFEARTSRIGTTRAVEEDEDRAPEQPPDPGGRGAAPAEQPTASAATPQGGPPATTAAPRHEPEERENDVPATVPHAADPAAAGAAPPRDGDPALPAARPAGGGRDERGDDDR
ncbi:hypothetical protein [Streptomyces marincola]|uniref:TrbL/VirB6 plasmid conjugal transfer protein n=1 Tax=Streptomyces marincola TaxID=2878388 RepID=A0A1W7CWM2_9ACTN|nr:hypothetical protein [Streptomyces marincola]ARQ69172.1 hypothetical protein CAG99_10125 [Streptomyces marincola]